MSKIASNILFFQQNIEDFKECFVVENYIQDRYKTIVYMLDYEFEYRADRAKLHNKKFGFVLKTIKP